MKSEEAERQELHCRKQKCYDKRSHPCKKEELGAETPQQVGDTPRLPNNLPHVCTIEEEQLVLLLVMQMMWIGQSEKEKDRYSEKKCIYKM